MACNTPLAQEAALETALKQAATVLKDADALLIATGAGMGVDSGLGTFRGRNAGVWPPLKAMQMDFSEMSCPSWFDSDPRLAWAFWHFRHQAYTLGTPHDGYRILSDWGTAMPHGAFSVTSNIDGHWERTEGIGATRTYECHGAVTRMQRVAGSGIWPTDPAQIAAMQVPAWDLACGEAVEACVGGCWKAAAVADDGCSMLVSGTPERANGVRRPGGPDLMRVLPSSPLPVDPEGAPARPNVLMFGDWGVDCEVITAQEAAFDSWCSALPCDVKLAIVEVGAGTAVRTIRSIAEASARRFQKSTLIRINLEDARVSVDNGISIDSLGALDALSRIDKLMRH